MTPLIYESGILAAAVIGAFPLLARRAKNATEIRTAINSELQSELCCLVDAVWEVPSDAIYAVVRRHGGWLHVIDQARIMVKSSIEAQREGLASFEQVTEMRSHLDRLLSLVGSRIVIVLRPRAHAVAAAIEFAAMAAIWEEIEIDSYTPECG